MNPITAIFDPLERLINEHGSAAILRDHVALFKDQLAILKEKFAGLETDKKNLEMENQKLKTENTRLKEKIEIYEKSDAPLEKIEVEILLSLAKQKHTDITPEYIAQSLGTNLEIIIFYIENLKLKKLIETRPIAPFDHSPKRFCSLAQEGRRYLIKHQLIS